MGTNLSKVDTSAKYCNDRSVETGTWSATSTVFRYAAYERISLWYVPTFSCSSKDIYTLKVGLLTLDEVAYAGGTYGTIYNNTSYYLYNGQKYWTMSPDSWDGNHSWPFVSIVNLDGNAESKWVGDYNIGLRPVINLKSDTTFQSGGTGTLDNPYVVL